VNRRSQLCVTLLHAGALTASLAAAPALAALDDAVAPHVCAELPEHALRAAAAGNAQAQAAVGEVLLAGFCGATPAVYAEGVGWLERAAEQGHAAAAARLALALERGEGVRPDVEHAIALYRRAAADGYVPAKQRLGLLLVSAGEVAAREEGLYWLGVAAGSGDGAAAAALGLIHAEGLHGVERDVCLALDWFEASALIGAPAPLLRLRADIPQDTARAC